MQWSPYFGSFAPYAPSAPGYPYPGPYFNNELNTAASNTGPYPTNGHSYVDNFVQNALRPSNSNDDSSSNNDSNGNGSNESNNNNNDSDDESTRQMDWDRIRQVMANYLTPN